MKYCPKCGCELAARPEGGRERPCCPTCDYVYFGTHSIGVGGVVIQENRVLLVRRAHDPGKGRWTIPGGYVEADELMEDCIVREVLEETGIQTEVEGIINVRQQYRDTGNNVYIVFRLRQVGGVVRPDGVEVDELGFLSDEEWAALPGLAPLTRHIITRALAMERIALRRLHPDGLNMAGFAMFGDTP